MAKKLKLEELKDNFSEFLEHVATYGLDSLSDKDKALANDLAYMAQEYIQIHQEENVDEVDEYEDDEE